MKSKIDITIIEAHNKEKNIRHTYVFDNKYLGRRLDFLLPKDLIGIIDNYNESIFTVKGNELRRLIFRYNPLEKAYSNINKLYENRSYHINRIIIYLSNKNYINSITYNISIYEFGSEYLNINYKTNLFSDGKAILDYVPYNNKQKGISYYYMTFMFDILKNRNVEHILWDCVENK